MILIAWDELPEFMKNEEVKKYYDLLYKKKGSLRLKRIFDIIMSVILLVVLSPIFIVLAIWIKIDSKGSVFYRQERVTQYGRIFRIFKFRTMVMDADKNGSLVTTQGDQRVTKVGKHIRKCRLDELPQLFNIITGDMSFVGARPEVRKFVDRYTDKMKATLLFPAGVTSLASIKFKNEDEIIKKYQNLGMSIDDLYLNYVLPDKMAINLEYFQEFSNIKDLMICIKTIIF